MIYSLGLGIPFVFSAVLLEKLSGAFTFITATAFRCITTLNRMPLIPMVSAQFLKPYLLVRKARFMIHESAP